ncbi:T-lymphocyte activation antigen CD86-like isoform X1 [Salmo trutta]|uniref:T-lymphocyte activation antigen CD86-like isoform X1 n=1 Tax=Salmo trutta TaxID=8032 RepID=UPI00113116C3|nr:T-lymphocyte activation antigen CD86-like isoform X1 [Salmo trutta]
MRQYSRLLISSQMIFLHRGMSTLVFIFLLFAPAASELEVTGIIGESVLLACDLNSSTAIDTARLRFYWQDKSGKVLYSFNKGEENKHQDNLHTNRTKAFGSEMSSGNISIKLSQVTLQDKQTIYWAFATLFDENGNSIFERTKVCPTTLHVAARFLTPSVTVNKTNMNATCSTQGGYPQPVVTWTIQDVLLAQNRTLDPWEVQTNITLDSESGLYTVWSQVNLTENQTVTCRIFNPVLRETVSNTTIVSPSQSFNTDPAGEVQEGFTPSIIGVIITVLILICFGVFYFVYKKGCGARGGATGASSGATGASSGATGPTDFPQLPEVVLLVPELVLLVPELVLQEQEVVPQEPEVMLQEPEVEMLVPEVLLQETEVMPQETAVVLQEVMKSRAF